MLLALIFRMEFLLKIPTLSPLVNPIEMKLKAILFTSFSSSKNVILLSFSASITANFWGVNRAHFCGIKPIFTLVIVLVVQLHEEMASVQNAEDHWP